MAMKRRRHRSRTGCCSSNRSSCSTLVMVAFVFARPLHLEPATIAMFGAAVLMLLDNWAHHTEKAAHNIHSTFGDVEWITIFFFIGLFVVVHGVDVGGLLKLLANKLVAATGGNWRTPATPSCGRRRCCRRSSTTSRSSPP